MFVNIQITLFGMLTKNFSDIYLPIVTGCMPGNSEIMEKSGEIKKFCSSLRKGSEIYSQSELLEFGSFL